MNKIKLYSILSLISLAACVIIGLGWTLFLLDVLYPLLRDCFDKLDNSYGIFIDPSTYAIIFLIPTAIVVSLIYIAAEKIGEKLKISRNDFLIGFGVIPLAITPLGFVGGLLVQSLPGVILAFMCAVAYALILLFCGARAIIGKLCGKPAETACDTE